jgi:hypothetical protein
LLLSRLFLNKLSKRIYRRLFFLSSLLPAATPLHAHPRSTDFHRCGSIPVAMDRFASPSTYSYPPSTDSRPPLARPPAPPACPPPAIAPPLARLLRQLACWPAILLAAGRRSPDFWRRPAPLLAVACSPPAVARLLYGMGID